MIGGFYMDCEELCQAIKCNNLSSKPYNCGECIALKLREYINNHYTNPEKAYEIFVKYIEEMCRDK